MFYDILYNYVALKMDLILRIKNYYITYLIN